MVCVREMDAGVVESCGKFDKIVPPGCHCIMFPYQTISARVSLRVRHLEIVCETKSKDNVFVSVVVGGIDCQFCYDLELCMCHAFTR